MLEVGHVLAALLGAVRSADGATREIGADSTFCRPEGVRASVGDAAGNRRVIRRSAIARS